LRQPSTRIYTLRNTSSRSRTPEESSDRSRERDSNIEQHTTHKQIPEPKEGRDAPKQKKPFEPVDLNIGSSSSVLQRCLMQIIDKAEQQQSLESFKAVQPIIQLKQKVKSKLPGAPQKVN